MGPICRSSFRLGFWTLPLRQWGATGFSEQGWAVAPLISQDRLSRAVPERGHQKETFQQIGPRLLDTAFWIEKEDRVPRKHLKPAFSNTNKAQSLRDKEIRDIVLLSHCRDLGTAPAQRACRRRQSGVTLSHAHQSRSPISSWVTGKETVDLRRHGPGCGARRHHMLRGGSPESLRCSGSEPCARAGRRLWTQLCWGDSPLPTGVPTKGPGSKDAGSIQSSGETWASIPKQTLSKGFLFNQTLFLKKKKENDLNVPA